MKTSLFLLLLALSAVPGFALDLPARSPTPPGQTAPAEVTLTGVLQRRVSIGGETTGWVLRYDKNRTIELAFTVAALAQIREGAWVACTGTYEVRHYPERGDVRILVVREIHEIVT
jgi:hypothetical protein